MALLGALPSAFANAQASTAPTLTPVGVWLNEEKDGRIEIYAQGELLYGKVVWVHPSRVLDPKTGKPQLDAENPNPALRSRPVLGLVIMQRFRPSKPGLWEDGEIYDPNDGKTYSCLMRMMQPNVLDIRGYVGFSWLGRTTRWTRVQP